MKINPSLALNTVIAVAVAYVVYRVFGASDSFAAGAKNFSEGVRAFFGDTSFLGEGVALSGAGQLSRDEYIKRGYLVVLPNGRTQITAEGNMYIDEQRRTAALAGPIK